MSDAARRQSHLLELRREAEWAIKHYPGVMSVALGYKVRGGRMTEEIAFRVYVNEKKPLSELCLCEAVPRHYKNVPTDVLKVSLNESYADPTPCANRQQYSTLAGGITISTLKPQANNSIGVGTLGFFATFTGVDPPYNIALVSNQHVFADAGGAVGDTIFQPKWAPQPDGSIAPLLDQGDVVGTILKMLPQADVNGSYVDAASVQLNICISSLCHTNCGVSFANKIPGLALSGGDGIKDVSSTVNIGDVVYKVGCLTGRTVGKVTCINKQLQLKNGTLVNNNIEIQATAMQTADNCGGTLRFAEYGDSGAALIDANRNLIGLIHGGDHVNRQLAHACHIQPVLDALSVAAITEANPVHDNPAAEGMMSDERAIIDGRPSQTAALRAKFRGCEKGRRVWETVEQCRHEVVHLVNHNRRVAVAWRRNEGPAFLNRTMNNVRDPEQRIPRVISGVTRQALLANMADALTKYGSRNLQRAVEENRREALAYLEDYDSLHDLVNTLSDEQPV